MTDSKDRVLAAPARSPALTRLGLEIHGHRKKMKISSVAAAGAAGISRITLYRIERGEASVSMGAYLKAAEALGLTIGLGAPANAAAARPDTPDADSANSIHLGDYPQLKQLAWPIGGVDTIAPADALNIYERNWRHIDLQSMGERERTLVRQLVERYGHGAMLV